MQGAENHVVLPPQNEANVATKPGGLGGSTVANVATCINRESWILSEIAPRFPAYPGDFPCRNAKRENDIMSTSRNSLFIQGSL